MKTVPKITLKKCNKEDWKIVKRMEKSAKSKLFHPIEREEEIKEYIAKSKVYIILQKNNPIGTVSYKIKRDGHIMFNGLTVLPKYRNKGIGLAAVKKILRKTGGRKAELVTHPENTPALIIYLKLGFKLKGWKDNYFGDGEPRVILWKN